MATTCIPLELPDLSIETEHAPTKSGPLSSANSGHGPVLIGILRQPFPLQGQAPGQQEQRIDPFGPIRPAKKPSQQVQEGVAGGEAAAKFRDRFCPVPGSFALEQHRPTGQVETPCVQVSPQGVIGPAIAELQQGYSSLELRGEGELAAERATAVVNENQGHRAIMAIAPPTP